MRRKVLLFDSFPLVDSEVHGEIFVPNERNSQKLYPVSGITFPILTAQNYLATRNVANLEYFSPYEQAQNKQYSN